MKYFFILAIFFSFSFAHKLNLFVTNENDSLEIYSYFASGAPCKNCKLIIKSDEKILLEDILNDEGKYNYKPTNKNIEVVVDASGGHIAIEKIEIENLKTEDINEHKIKEKRAESIKILIALMSILLIFFLLKRRRK
jgi:nickel transport protein